MSIDLQPGQTWRNRGGQFVTVEFKASANSWYMKYEAQPDRAGYLVNIDGRTKRTHRSDLDLAERAERVYVSVGTSGEGRAKLVQDTVQRYRDKGCYVNGTSAEGPQQAITMLMTCEIIVMLPDYESHPFAMLELHVAEGLGLTVVWPGV